MRYCWLLVAWATISHALVVLYPQPNSNLPIGVPFRLTWMTTETTPNQKYISIYLLSSPSPTDVVQVLGTSINDQIGGWQISVSQVQPNNYYIYLNDSNIYENNIVAGPFYFTNSVTTPPAPPTASSTVPSSASSGPPRFPVWIIPIIVVMVLAVRPNVRKFLKMKPYQVDAYTPQAKYAPQSHQPYFVNYSPTSPPPQQRKSSGDYY
ncbi:hypothetical protein INT43_005913 [Umbelopsis isabellina]|uniref:Yeast cell wall synthesis Kre9/Knh1-like N-terminal domain-containing protein n=1 Tax=Mortierella isabellina TaxID=91625 RepID=A0A8H7PJ32_MORIS|nr:hypothetical protein INT43_005913 [Umbelopsis isabellina]